ncbi:MAG TPA: hypothetical protein VF190_03850 [Rhodothermales bacterium]
MKYQPNRVLRVVAALTLCTLVASCDELPDDPEVPDRLRVALVTSRADTDDGPRWFIYEIDQEGTVTEIVTSTEPISFARYTSFRGTQGSIAYLEEDGDLVVRHLASGSTRTITGPFGRPRFSGDGSLIAYTRAIEGEDGAGREQVFVLDSISDDLSQVTLDECTDTASPPNPCAFESIRPVFGEDNELYMVRFLRTNEGAEQVSISAFTTSQLEQRYIVQPIGGRTLYPNSVFEGSLVVSYAEQEGTSNEVLGFYAINVRTGQWIENQIQMRDASYCFDATIMGVQGTELRVVDVAGDDVDRVQLPAAYGTDILSVECSVQSRDIVR